MDIDLNTPFLQLADGLNQVLPVALSPAELAELLAAALVTLSPDDDRAACAAESLSMIFDTLARENDHA